MKTAAALTLLALLSVQVSVVPSLACNHNEYSKDGKCCQKCPPGQKLVAECTAESESRCADCSPREFQEQWNIQKFCQTHNPCDLNAGFVKQTQGTAEKDTVCSCRKGLHCSSAQCETCEPHTTCRQGYGVTRPADNLSDTKCEPCQEGTFSNETSLTEPCRPWTSCEARDLVTEVPGSDVSDATCGEKPRSWVAAWTALGAIAILIIVVAGVIWIFQHKASLTCLKNQLPFQLVQQDPIPEPEKRGQIPVEIEDPAGSPDHRPVQETTAGGQPVEEDWKDSRLPQQEVV